MKPLRSMKQRNFQIKALERQDNDLPPRRRLSQADSCDPPLNTKVNFPPEGNLKRQDSDSTDDDLDSLTYFETFLVLEFNKEISEKALHWIIDKIRGKKLHGGAGLLIRKEPLHE